jgi:hypothetical protein
MVKDARRMLLTVTRRRRWALAISLLAIGCSGRPGAVATPDVDPDDAADLAFEEYDADSNGVLAADELAACPALIDAMGTYDANHDGSLGREELVAGIGSWEERGAGALALSFRVEMDRRPLGGAEVKLIPVAFLGDAVKPASGIAGDSGSGSLNIAADDRPANLPPHIPVIQPGLYRVEITHPTANVPAKYNSESTLGIEAAIAGQNPAGVTWSLTSK